MKKAYCTFSSLSRTVLIAVHIRAIFAHQPSMRNCVSSRTWCHSLRRESAVNIPQWYEQHRVSGMAFAVKQKVPGLLFSDWACIIQDCSDLQTGCPFETVGTREPYSSSARFCHLPNLGDAIRPRQAHISGYMAPRAKQTSRSTSLERFRTR